MPAQRLYRFDGMRPGWDARLIEDNQGSYSRDAFLFDGKLVGWRTPKPLWTLVNPAAQKAYRIPVALTATKITDPSYWLEFIDADTDVIRSPTPDDTFQRYYWCSPSVAPSYNTVARIAAGNAGANAPFLLGVPTPGCPPVLTATGGGTVDSSLQEARAYVYTWVTAYGEESAPSDFSLLNAFSDSTYQIDLTTPAPADMGQGANPTRNIATTRIYRTVTSLAGDATYFFVVEVPVTTNSYVDVLTDQVVSLNNILQTATWGPPPSDLQGIIQMPNGMIAGFRQNEVWFCEPYYPHAWPSVYTITTEFPIVGLGVTGQSVVVATEGYPVVVTGISPSTSSVAQTHVSQPCLSRGGIISGDVGVFYAGKNGLILCQGSGFVVNFTEGWITPDKWQQLTPQSGVRAINLMASYFAFAPTVGYTIDFGSANMAARWLGFNNMSAPNGNTITNLMTDHWTGSGLMIQNGVVGYYDFADTAPTVMPYLWKSKSFQQTWAHNFEVMKVYFDIPPNIPVQSPVRTVDPIQALMPGQYAIVRVYADDVLVTTRELRTSGEVLRILSGFKATYWQWEIEGRVSIRSIHAATSMKELREV